MNRQVINAKYEVYSTFVIPEGIDVENKEQVEKWWIRRDTLHIEMKDGRKISVLPHIRAFDSEFKTPDSTKVEEEEIYEDDEYDEKALVSIR